MIIYFAHDKKPLLKMSKITRKSRLLVCLRFFFFSTLLYFFFTMLNTPSKNQIFYNEFQTFCSILYEKNRFSLYYFFYFLHVSEKLSLSLLQNSSRALYTTALLLSLSLLLLLLYKSIELQLQSSGRGSSSSLQQQYRMVLESLRALYPHLCLSYSLDFSPLYMILSHSLFFCIRE